jgi:glycosyltransferase involved in cell wall biosynthesis
VTVRIALVGVNYRPEVTGIAPYTADAAEHLTSSGHDVRVCTGFPHYPRWAADPRYGSPRIREVINGVQVTRVRHHVPARPSLTGRSRLELSVGRRLVMNDVRGASDADLSGADLVICVTPALLTSACVVAYLRTRSARPRIGVWVQDLYGRGIVQTGSGGTTAAAAISAVESAVFRAADGVAVIHERFAEHVVDSLGVHRERVSVVPNWNHQRHVDRPSRVEARRMLGWSQDAVIAVHAGNMGVKQGLHTVVDAARVARDRGRNVHFYLVGDGNQREALERSGDGVDTMTFLRPLPDDQFRASLAAADVLLVNELPTLTDMAVPSKLTTYFASGTPVLAATSADSVTSAQIELSGAGRRIDPGDPESLLAAVIDMASDAPGSARMGLSGRGFADSALSRSVGVSRIGEWADGLLGMRMSQSERH